MSELNQELLQQIRETLWSTPNITTRAIHKRLNVDKSILLVHLHRMNDIKFSKDRIVRWSMKCPRQDALSELLKAAAELRVKAWRDADNFEPNSDAWNEAMNIFHTLGKIKGIDLVQVEDEE